MDGLPADGFEPGPFAGVIFAPRAPHPPPSRAQRGLVAGIVIALHALFAWVIEDQSHRRADAIAAHAPAVAVDFIDVLPPQVVRAERVQQIAPMRIVPARPTAPRDRPTPAAPRTPARDVPLQLYDAEGRLRLPEGTMRELDRQAADPQFDFQYPGLADAGHFMQRPKVLAYEPTRFDRYWKPNEDLLNAVLRKAAEKTTKEVRIPIPGAPGRKLVCRVSLLAAGGACGVERDEEWHSPGQDDPDTLSPAEAAACAAWWARIVDAHSQDEWRATRKLYEEECRKPLAPAPVAQ